MNNYFSLRSTVRKISVVLALSSVLGCQKDSGKTPIISVGDGVTLAKNSYACKSALTDLNDIEIIKANIAANTQGALTEAAGCHPVNGFLKNDEWIVQKVLGKSLLVLMEGYVGEYWVSSGAVTTTGKTHSVKTVAVPVAVEIHVPFDQKVTALAPGFVSDDPWKVYSLISSQDLVQGKFEKKPAYLERMKSLSTTTLSGGITLNDSFIFKLDRATQTYNADKEEMSFVNHGDFYLASRDYDSQRWKEYYKTKFKDVYEKEEVIIKNSNVSKDHYYSYQTKFKMSPAEAKELDGKLTIYVVGKFVSPFLNSDLVLPLEYDETTVYFKKYFIFSVDGIWIVDTQSGKVLAKKFTTKKEV